MLENHTDFTADFFDVFNVTVQFNAMNIDIADLVFFKAVQTAY